jgi:hypothetical protein
MTKQATLQNYREERMGTYFIVRCYIKHERHKQWAVYEYGPYLTLNEASVMMVDHLKPLSVTRFGKGKLKTKIEIHEVVMTEIGKWDTLQIRVEETERFFFNE